MAWDVKYDADVLPTLANPPWAFAYSSSMGAQTVSGGFLTMTGDVNWQQYKMSNSVSTKGLHINIRLRISSVGSYGQNIRVGIKGFSTIDTLVSTNFVSVAGTGYTSDTTGYYVDMTVYRNIEIFITSNGLATFYVDNVLIKTVQLGTSSPSTETYLSFLTVQTSSIVVIDYMYVNWSSTVDKPSPLPTTSLFLPTSIENSL